MFFIFIFKTSFDIFTGTLAPLETMVKIFHIHNILIPDTVSPFRMEPSDIHRCSDYFYLDLFIFQNVISRSSYDGYINNRTILASIFPLILILLL